MSYIRARVLCVGEAMVELSNTNFATNSTSIGIAGDTLNTAIYIKRLLGDQVVVDYLTVLGVDFYSDQILNYIASEGVGTEKIRRISSSGPGIYAISTDKLGERSFSYWRDNSAAKTLFGRSVDFESMLGYDFIYFSGISLAILAQRARDDFQRWVTDKRGDISFFFDSNYRKTLWLNTVIAQSTIEKALRNSTIAFASLDDHKQLTGQNNEASIVNGLEKSGATQVVLKRGEDGPLLIGKTFGHIEQSCFLKENFSITEGLPPEVNLNNEKNNGETILKLIRKNLVLSAHDVSSGGLLVALSEMSIGSNLGAKILKPRKLRNKLEYFFGEDQGRYVIEINSSNLDQIIKILEDDNIYFENIGKTQKEFFEVEGELKLNINDLFKINNTWYNKY